MSYGFPVTGDDWFFYSCDHKTLSIRDQLSRAIQISIEHYQGTNGRLLGNFLVSLFLQKALREIVRCGIILVILLSVYRLSGNRGLPTYLMCFALLIAMPAKNVAQTYAWAAGFFNYVPSGMLVLLYFRYAEQRFCEGTPRRSVSWSILLLLLGFSTQPFMENITIGVCILSAALFVLDCVRKKRPDPALAAHLIGAVVGCAVMFLAPGYKNVGHEGYRELPSDYTCIVQVFEENFKKLSVSLTSENLLVIILLCLSGGRCVYALWRHPTENG
ncbi:MAG: hypothetical protein IIY70_00535 [Oscillospiraceae bacterium]|nr:hypothetical protein [Oscillospiraceae bacterium]